MIMNKEQLKSSTWQDTLVNSYNTSMLVAQGVAEKGEVLTDLDKAYILSSVGALLSALGVANFNGVYTMDNLVNDIKKHMGGVL